MSGQPDATKVAPAVEYRRGLDAGRLRFQRCTACGSAVFHPRVLCPDCGATSLEWQDSAGLGTVYATTTMHARGREPYNVALIDLDEGFRMMSRVEGVPPDDVVIGARVCGRVVEADGAPLVVFHPEVTA